MAVTSVVTVNGSTAEFTITDSGGFGIFSSYSAFATESATAELTVPGRPSFGTGSADLTLSTGFGNLVFAGTDTIQAVDGVYQVFQSEALTFVVGDDTLTLMSMRGAVTGSGLGSFEAGLEGFFSSVLSVDGIVNLPDTIDAAIASAVAYVETQATAASVQTTEHRLSDNSTITVTKLG